MIIFLLLAVLLAILAPFLFWTIFMIVGAYVFGSIVFMALSAFAGGMVQPALNKGRLDNLQWYHVVGFAAGAPFAAFSVGSIIWLVFSTLNALL